MNLNQAVKVLARGVNHLPSFVKGYEQGFQDGVKTALPAVSDGLRKGSKVCGKFMSNWRWRI